MCRTGGFTFIELVVMVVIVAVVGTVATSVVLASQNARTMINAKTSASHIVDYVSARISVGDGKFLPFKEGDTLSWNGNQIESFFESDKDDYTDSSIFEAKVTHQGPVITATGDGKTVSSNKYQVQVCWKSTSSECYENTLLGPNSPRQAGDETGGQIEVGEGFLRVNVTAEGGNPTPQVVVQGPDGYENTITKLGITDLTKLSKGSYSIVPAAVKAYPYDFAASVISTQVEAGQGATAQVKYQPSSAAIKVIVGLPPVGSPKVTLAGPDGYNKTLTGSETLAYLKPGAYHISASTISTSNSTYAPSISGSPLTIQAGETQATSVSYNTATGSLKVAVTAPDNLKPRIQVDGPSGFLRLLSGAETLKNLPLGVYTIVAQDILQDDFTYRAVAEPAAVNLQAASAASTLVAYHPADGKLRVDSLFPVGFSVPVQLKQGAAQVDGYTYTGSESREFSHLLPGWYTLEAAPVQRNGMTYQVKPNLSPFKVDAGLLTVSGMTLNPVTGLLDLKVLGLPAGVAADVSVIGIGIKAHLTTSDTLVDVKPGEVLITPADVHHVYTYSAPVSTAQVVAGTTTTRTVQYLPSTGLLKVNISVVTEGTANLSLGMPNGTVENLKASTVLESKEGSVSVKAMAVEQAGITFQPSAPTRIDVLNGSTSQLNVVYKASDAILNVEVTGLPSNLKGNLRLTGPAAYVAFLEGSQTFSKLKPGTYTLTANKVSSALYVYGPVPQSQQVTLNAGDTRSSSVKYAPVTGAITLTFPAGFIPSSTLKDPQGNTRSITQNSITLTNLTEGVYTLVNPPVTSGGYTYTSSNLTITVQNGKTTAVSVPYQATEGTLNVTVDPLEVGHHLSITSADGKKWSLTSATMKLPTGNYVVQAENVELKGELFVPDTATYPITINAAKTTPLTVKYTKKTVQSTVKSNRLTASKPRVTSGAVLQGSRRPTWFNGENGISWPSGPSGKSKQSS